MSEVPNPVDADRSALRRSIAGRLLFWFLVIALIPCAILTAITARIASTALEKSVRDNLVQIAAGKAVELEAYAAERIRDGAALSRGPTFIRAVRELTAAPAAATAAGGADFREYFTYVAKAFEYAQLLLIDESGRVLFSLDDSIPVGSSLSSGALASSELAAGHDRSRTLVQPDLGGFQAYGKAAVPLAFVTCPILDGGRVSGVLALGLGPQRVWKMLSDLGGLGDTGEIVAGELQGNSVLVTTPLRHAANAAFRMRIPLGSAQASATQWAAGGDRGYGPARDYRGEDVAAAWCYVPSFRWGLVIKQDADEAFALVRFQRLAIIGLSLATIVGVTAAALVVARTISNPIRTAVAVAKQVAGGDLRADVGIVSNDETGALLAAVQTMTNDLRGLIGRIQHSSVALISTATAIQATSSEQQQVIADYGASTSQAVAAVKQISVTSQELLRTMTEVNDMAGHTGTMAAAGRVNLAGMDGTMRQLAASTSSFGAKLAVISERAANINLAVTTITKVADQTNLLSINAAIEAEKAGEYGLGFLVVAREIRRLADQTAVASLDIERMVKEMQYSVSAGVMEMDKFAEQVRAGVREIGEVSEKLGEIITAVQGISGRFGQVTEGMRAQSQGAEQIREAMIRLAEGAARTASSLNEFNGATVHLRDAVGDLKEEVSRFTI
ncbi:MAG: methyl-accepting chemotaxis protein [Planctomycetota bacterium]|jgi:methyl-accepting chemotaxis protein WspA|nr:MAG: methyl-accepting chemotaxis protein [Planctomycetota bacterium]